MLKPISNLSILRNNRKPKDFYDNYIKNRFAGDVLRKSKQIHSFDEYGQMIPCSKNKTIIKKVLLSVFDT